MHKTAQDDRSEPEESEAEDSGNANEGKPNHLTNGKTFAAAAANGAAKRSSR